MLKRFGFLCIALSLVSAPLVGCSTAPSDPVVNEAARGKGFKKGENVKSMGDATADREMPEGVQPID